MMVAWYTALRAVNVLLVVSLSRGGVITGHLDGFGEELSYDFIQASSHDGQCDGWKAEELHQQGLDHGNIIVYKTITSVGNLFLSLPQALKTAQALGSALTLDSRGFPGFRAALEPNKIQWDMSNRLVDLLVGKQGGIPMIGQIPERYLVRFSDGFILADETMLSLLARAAGVQGELDSFCSSIPGIAGNRMGNLFGKVQASIAVERYDITPCAWNKFFKRSETMQEALITHRGQIPTGTFQPYVSWHVRTPSGETASSYDPVHHGYIFAEPLEDVCRAFFKTMVYLMDSCRLGDSVLPVHLASNSLNMKGNCTAMLPTGKVSNITYVDLGLGENDGHTAYSADPEAAAINSFLDYFYMMDAPFIIRGGSSFSGSIVSLRGMRCSRVPDLGEAITASGRINICWIGDACF
ncbi:unnamed protein product [Phaeothamnion confervicola]